ncbi:MAG: GGDEF domain-containing protein [Eubacteriales bacterium]|nr:GGDEF domain-containing protein [Eubacteriales bacterium]
MNLPSAITSRQKYKAFIILCFLIHIMIIGFALFNHITPLVLFNFWSILVYTLSFLLLKYNQRIVFYMGYFEIIIHSFVCVLVLGDGFGFPLYFVAIVPIGYQLLYSTKDKKYKLIATMLAGLSFILYTVCYIISHTQQPLYSSESLNRQKPFVYVINIFVIFVAVVFSSVAFMIEAENAYHSIENKNKELDDLANTDALTCLRNRRSMMDSVISLFQAYKKPNQTFSLVICDIDNFKQFNDTYGHECGDVVLKNIAQKFLLSTRKDDYVCRWGGEEFLFVLKNISQKDAHTITERIRINIANTEIQYNDEILHITMTFGVASSDEADNYDDLFKLADNRLYQGKNSGKNIVI